MINLAGLNVEDNEVMSMPEKIIQNVYTCLKRTEYFNLYIKSIVLLAIRVCHFKNMGPQIKTLGITDVEESND